MNSLLAAALFALAPAAPAARCAHDARYAEPDWALHEPPPPAVVVVWDEANIRFLDDEPAAARPAAPADPVRYLPGTRIRLRTGFTPRALHAEGDVRF